MSDLPKTNIPSDICMVMNPGSGHVVVWKAGLAFRFKRSVMGSVLQQAWISDQGQTEWRDVPTVEE